MFERDLLKGRAIFITGGGTGLGRAMSLRLAELGARIFLMGRREDPLRQTAEAINQAGSEAAWAIGDVRDPDAVEAAVAAAEKRFGPVDTLINNAAGNFAARTEKLSPNAFDAVVRIVLHGSFHCTMALGRRWIEARRPGTVLNILATYAATGSGSGFVVPSACAKAGVLMLTRSLAVEWARYNIRLNAIAPGPFPTEGATSRLMPSQEFLEKTRQGLPMKRFGKPQELANLAAFLVSEQSGYINGECVIIDGARWLRGAGEFNDLLQLPDSMWQAMEASRKR